MLVRILWISSFIIVGCDNPQKQENYTETQEQSHLVGLDSLCKEIYNSYQCAQEIEKHQILIYPSIVLRKDSALIFPFQNGERVIFEDSGKGTDEARLYSFRNHYPKAGLSVVEVQKWEGGFAIILNHKTKEKIEIWGVPFFTDDFKRFVTSNLDLEAGYSENGFQVWAINGTQITKEFEFETDDWGPGKVKWVDNDHIKVSKIQLTEKGETKTGEMIFKHQNGRWVQ